MGKCRDCERHERTGKDNWIHYCRHPDSSTESVEPDFPWCSKFSPRQRRYRLKEPVVIEQEEDGVCLMRFGSRTISIWARDVYEQFEEVT